MINWISHNFGNIANYSSIFGFLISCYVMYNLKKIRKHYEFKARIPEIVAQLNAFSKDLNDFINDIASNRNEIILTIKKLEYTLKSLKKKSNEEITKSIKTLLRKTKNLKRGRPVRFIFFSKQTWVFEDETWEIYTDIQGILQGVKPSVLAVSSS
jgi:hypothetical protein